MGFVSPKQEYWFHEISTSGDTRNSGCGSGSEEIGVRGPRYTVNHDMYSEKEAMIENGMIIA